MSDLIRAQEVLSRFRGRVEAQPDNANAHVHELELRNRMLLAEVADLRAKLRNARRPIIVRRACA